MNSDPDRRKFLRNSSVAAVGLIAGSGVSTAHSQDGQSHVAPKDDDFPRKTPGRGGDVGTATDRGKLVAGFRSSTEAPVPVVMPDLDRLSWNMVNGAKEFHLRAEHLRRELLPNQWFDFWGYNASMPGPLIEANEGDRVRIIVHNDLPEPTTVHWHGLELPNAMDGVPGLTQDPIPAGGKFVYEFDLHQNGTFFYHSHGGMQEIMGMSGLFVIHPKKAHTPAVDHDFGLIMQEFAILPQNTVPNSVSEEFNFFTINGRSGPYLTPLVVRLGSRVRIRFMNLSAMDHHPMHLHGHSFWVTGTEAGRIPESAWIPTNNVLVGVGQSRDVEFIANNPGDWMLHCHILHHMMNHMVSMVGPMAAMGGSGSPSTHRMPSMTENQLASGELGAALEPSLGPASGDKRAIMTGMRPSDMQAKFKVPGYPQDMMDMHGAMSSDQMQKLQVPLTRGMRRNWPMGVMAMMTVLRVLPDELYEKVVSGMGEVEPGASVPGGGPGEMMDHGKHEMHNAHEMHDSPKSESSHSSEHAGHNMEKHEGQPKETPQHHHDE